MCCYYIRQLIVQKHTWQKEKVHFISPSQFKQAVAHITQPCWACLVKSALFESLVTVTVIGFHNTCIMRTVTESNTRCHYVIREWWRIICWVTTKGGHVYVYSKSLQFNTLLQKSHKNISTCLYTTFSQVQFSFIHQHVIRHNGGVREIGHPED